MCAFYKKIHFRQVFSTPNRRLPLQFSPNNIFCKPAYGDQRRSTGILVKVKIRRPKNKSRSQQIISPTVSIVAMVDTIYEFDCKSLLLKLVSMNHFFYWKKVSLAIKLLFLYQPTYTYTVCIRGWSDFRPLSEFLISSPQN